MNTKKMQLPRTLLSATLSLEKITPHHRESLRAACCGDDAIWNFFPINFNGANEHFDAWFDYTLERCKEGSHYAFVVRRRVDERVIGTTRYYDISLDHRRLAIGSTWYTKVARGTLINSEVRLLTLAYAFERLGMNRVELITDPRNLNSCAAMKILGAVQEGVMRQHMIYRDGRIRDSVLFSIILSEWPTVRERLLARLGYNEDALQHLADAT